MRAREHESASRFDALSQVRARLQLDAARAAAPDEKEHCLRLASVIFDCMRELQQQRGAAARIVYREAGDGLWELGPEGRAHQVTADSVIGARAAHMALQGLRPRCCELSAARDADRVLRRALRVHAAGWAERHGCRELAAAMQSIEIRDGRLQYSARPGAPTFVLA
jgi:hypothetical protein